MKTNKAKSIGWMICMLMCGCMLPAQDIIVTSTSTCQGGYEGSFLFDFTDDFLNEYDLPYEVEWENLYSGELGSFDMDSDLYRLDGLSIGEHAITIYVSDECRLSLRESIGRSGGIRLAWPDNNLHICNDRPGRLSVKVEGNIGDYELNWTLGNAWSESSIPFASNIDQITPSAPGYYCVTAIDAMGCEDKICKYVYSLSDKVIIDEVIPESECITALGEPVCCSRDGAISIRENTSFGSHIERYSWSGPNGFTSSASSLTNLQAGQYTLYIGYSLPDRDFVTEECPILIDVPGRNHYEAIEVIDKEPACAGLNDGQYSIRINNPNGDPVNVHYPIATCSDCGLFPIVQNSEHYSIDLNFTDLYGDRDYTFPMRIGTCRFDFTFSVGEEANWRTLSSISEVEEDVFYCNYDVRCGTDVVVENGVVELARLDANEDTCQPGNPFSSCGSIDYYCDDHLIHSRGVRRRSMRRLEAVVQARAMGFSEEIIAQHLSGPMCDILYVCPNNPLCRSLTLSGEFSGTDQGIEVLSNGCIKVNCTSFWIWNRDYTVCGLEFVPDYIRPYINTLSDPRERNCIPVTKSMAQLVHFLPFLEADYGSDFINSGLHSFLVRYQNRPEIYCADVTYCRDDFSLVGSNFNTVNCGVVEPPIWTGSFQITATCEPVYYGENEGVFAYCESPCILPQEVVCYEPRFISYDYDGFELIKDNPSTYRQIVGHSPETTRFTRFVHSSVKDGTLVNALFSSKEENIYHRFHPNKRIVDPGFNIDYVYRAPDKDELLAISKTDNNIYRLASSDLEGIEYFESEMNGSVSLYINDLYRKNGHYIISGEYLGDLIYKGATISSSSKRTKFRLRLSEELDVDELNDFAAEGTIWPSGYTKHITLVDGGKSGNIYDDTFGNNITVAAGAYKIIGDAEANVILDVPFKTTGELSLAQFDISTSKEFLYAIFMGSGEIVKNNQVVWTALPGHMTLLSYNIKNGDIRHTSFNSQGLNAEDILLRVKDDHSAVVSINYNSPLIINGTTYQPQGQSDILILQLDSDLNMVNTFNYGSEDDEKIVDLFVDGDLLYLGGELAGNTFSRSIGEMEFINLSGGGTQAFVSFVKLLPVQPSTAKSEINAKTSDTQHLDTYNLFPNPSSNELFLRSTFVSDIDRSNSYITDAKGAVMGSLNDISNMEGNDLLQIDISHLEDGLYFLNVKTTERYIPINFVKFNK